MNVNMAILIGRVGKDVETFPAGKDREGNPRRVVKVVVATKEVWKKSDGTWDERTEWHECTSMLPNHVENMPKFIQKGDTIKIVGQIKTVNYTTKEGEDRQKKEISIKEWERVMQAKKDAEHKPQQKVAPPKSPIPGVPDSVFSSDDDDTPF